MELVHYHKSLVGESNWKLKRLPKMLGDANIKIFGTITDIDGKNARNILEHSLSGKLIDSAEYDILYEKKAIAHNLFNLLFIGFCIHNLTNDNLNFLPILTLDA